MNKKPASLKQGAEDFDKWVKKQLKNKKVREVYEAETLRRNIALQLTYARKKRHMTQKKLASVLRMPQQQISKIENGEQNITVDTLGKILAGLKAKGDFHIAV